MQTTLKGLDYLSQIPTERSVAFFPSLQHVVPIHIHSESVAQVTNFLLWLKLAGGLIQHLDIGLQCNLERHGVSLSPLEQFFRLRVHWASFSRKKLEYICGSGTPERLDFVDSYPTP